MLTLKIRRDTIRANPDYGRSKRGSLSKSATFEATEEALIEDADGCIAIKYFGWDLGVNYYITDVERPATDMEWEMGLGRRTRVSVPRNSLKASGFCLGFSIPKTLIDGARWDGVTITIEDNDIVIDADHREFLFEYEDLPERVACPNCTTEFGGAMLAKDYRFEEGACLVCGHGLVKYEELDDVLRKLQNETRDDRFSDN